jgi:hypothetical protein
LFKFKFSSCEAIFYFPLKANNGLSIFLRLEIKRTLNAQPQRHVQVIL